jgi:peroxiredoxin
MSDSVPSPLSENISPKPLRRDGSKSYVLVLVALLVISAVVNVLLSQRTLQLNRRTQQLERMIQGLSDANQVQSGVWVPPISAVDETGHPVVLSYSTKNAPTILYVFTPQCVWCSRNLKSVKTLAKQTSGQYQFIALSLSDKNLHEYISQNKIEFPVYTGLENETLSAYKLGTTPQTIVISGDGRLVKNWQGAYVGDTLRQVEQFFGAKLPGLSSRADVITSSR